MKKASQELKKSPNMRNFAKSGHPFVGNFLNNFGQKFENSNFHPEYFLSTKIKRS